MSDPRTDGRNGFQRFPPIHPISAEHIRLKTFFRISSIESVKLAGRNRLSCQKYLHTNEPADKSELMKGSGLLRRAKKGRGCGSAHVLYLQCHSRSLRLAAGLLLLMDSIIHHRVPGRLCVPVCVCFYPQPCEGVNAEEDELLAVVGGGLYR